MKDTWSTFSSSDKVHHISSDRNKASNIKAKANVLKAKTTHIKAKVKVSKPWPKCCSLYFCKQQHNNQSIPGIRSRTRVGVKWQI